jgi:hypothetical protein
LEVGGRSAAGATGPRGGGAASQKGRPAGRGSEREEAEKRVEERKEGTIGLRLRYQCREVFSVALTHFSYSQPQAGGSRRKWLSPRQQAWLIF